jgi:L-ascorbate metabolism protein UlaG (beta-lactamase superfamily)
LRQSTYPNVRGRLAAGRAARFDHRPERGYRAAMLAPARHLAELARFALTRRAQECDDAEALAALEAAPLDLPGGLELEWLGVSGYRMTYEGHTLLIDPYLSRVPLRSLIRREPARPDRDALDRFLQTPGRVAGVLVGHTHFDHAVDAPEIARRARCPALGSRSLAALMRLHGLGDLAVEVVPYRTYEIGPFAVSFTPSAHSKLLLGLAVPFDGELTCQHLDRLSPSAYRCGEVWGIHVAVAGMSFYHQGSADLVDDAVRHRGVDVFLAGIAGRSFTRDYWGRILRRLEPRVVVPTHYDDFFRPLDDPMDFTANVKLASFPDEVRAVSRDFSTAAIPRLRVRGPAMGAGRPG